MSRNTDAWSEGVVRDRLAWKYSMKKSKWKMMRGFRESEGSVWRKGRAMRERKEWLQWKGHTLRRVAGYTVFCMNIFLWEAALYKKKQKNSVGLVNWLPATTDRRLHLHRMQSSWLLQSFPPKKLKIYSHFAAIMLYKQFIYREIKGNWFGPPTKWNDSTYVGVKAIQPILYYFKALTDDHKALWLFDSDSYCPPTCSV